MPQSNHSQQHEGPLSSKAAFPLIPVDSVVSVGNSVPAWHGMAAFVCLLTMLQRRRYPAHASLANACQTGR